MIGAARPGNKFPILTYHSIDDGGSVVSTSRATFSRQMGCLHEAGYRTVSVGDVAAHLEAKRPFPANAVAITFDDGYQNVYREAFPVLEKYGFRATVFLITDYCGKFNDWPGDSIGVQRQPLLSWAEIRELQAHGFEFGSHTATHVDLTKVPFARVESEIRQSKAEIQSRLGSEAALFAYPYGTYNRAIKGIVQETFAAACSTKLGKVQLDSDPFLLNRIDTYYLPADRLFSGLASRSLDWYLKLRQSLREVKTSGRSLSQRFQSSSELLKSNQSGEP